MNLGIALMATMSYNKDNLGNTKAAFAAHASNTAEYSHGLRRNTLFSGAQRMEAGDRHGASYGVGGVGAPGGGGFGGVSGSHDPLDLSKDASLAQTGTAATTAASQTKTGKSLVDEIDLTP